MKFELFLALWPLYLIVALALAGMFLFALIRGKRKYDLLYMRKPYLLNMTERKLFDLLNEALSPNYYVFPQVQIKSIIGIQKGVEHRGALFGHISQKSVDFVIFDKKNVGPLLAIELDGASHDRPNRIDRDRQVNEVFQAAGVTLMHIKTGELENPNLIKENITRALVTK